MSRFILGTVAILASAGLGGCVTAKPITGPDGTVNHLIACADIEYCYSKAREVCGGNYKIVNTSADTSGSDGNTSTSTRLLVKCDQ